MQKNVFGWLPTRWFCPLHVSLIFLLMSTSWNFKIEELLGHTVVVIALILLSTWDPLNNFSFSHPLVRTKMTKACLQKENIYQSLSHKSHLFLSPPQPFRTVENQLTETHNLNRNAYRYEDLTCGTLWEKGREKYFWGGISYQGYSNEWPGMRRALKVQEVWDKDQTCWRYSPFPYIFSCLQDASDLSQEFLHNSEATSLIPAWWWHCPERAVRWGRIAGGASLISARNKRLTQKRAGEAFPNPYGKMDIWKLNFWMRQEREKKRNWSCELW